MKDKLYKYANLLLKGCLNIKKRQPLVISAPIESISFIRILSDVACQMGINDIYYDWYDQELKHLHLKYFSKKGIKESQLFNKSIYNEYTNKNAAFLILVSSGKYIMDDINSSILKYAANYSLQSRKEFLNKQKDNKISWCIAGVATSEWANLIYGYDNNCIEKLWDTLFDICLINSDNPIKNWNDKITNNKKIANKLSELKIESLHYKNSLGTDFTIYLSKKAIWCCGDSIINGRSLIVNLPTEEVFTTPNKYKVDGVVYSKTPLVHSGVIIKDIMLEFKDGKVINYSASSGEEELKNIIYFDDESLMLGEVALVDKNTKISKSNILFYETLFDENAACHIALGSGFKECLQNGDKMNRKQLEDIGYNKSRNHVDIMIGTSDLNITAKCYNGNIIEIFKNGSFVI